MPRRNTDDIVAELKERELYDLAEHIAKKHACSIAEMLGPRRFEAFAHARQEFWSELYGTGHWSLPRLAKLFGRDHTTILAGIHSHYVRVMAPAVEATKLKNKPPLRFAAADNDNHWKPKPE